MAGTSCGKSEPGTTPQAPTENGASSSDTTPPSITDVLASDITDTTATITWTTDEPATSQVEYGKAADYGLTTPLHENLVTSHSVALSGLEPNTTYHFRVKSKDASDNLTVPSDYTFTTTKPTRQVSGLVSTDTTWTSDYLYVVTENVAVEQGVTLTIEPGTLVKFDSGCKLQVAGTLKAEGTSQDRISFTADTSNSTDWSGIELIWNANPEEGSVIAYVLIEHAAISVNNHQLSLLQHNVIRGGGISTKHTGGFDISHNHLIDSYIYSWCGPQVIAYNQITDCQYAMDITLGDNQEVFIQYNTLDCEGGIGISGSRSGSYEMP